MVGKSKPKIKVTIQPASENPFIGNRDGETTKCEKCGIEYYAAREFHACTSELDCLARIREAIGDNGKRMQPELVEYIRATFESERRLRAALEFLIDNRHKFGDKQSGADAARAALKIIPK